MFAWTQGAETWIMRGLMKVCPQTRLSMPTFGALVPRLMSTGWREPSEKQTSERSGLAGELWHLVAVECRASSDQSRGAKVRWHCGQGPPTPDHASELASPSLCPTLKQSSGLTEDLGLVLAICHDAFGGRTHGCWTNAQTPRRGLPWPVGLTLSR